MHLLSNSYVSVRNFIGTEVFSNLSSLSLHKIPWGDPYIFIAC